MGMGGPAALVSAPALSTKIVMPDAQPSLSLNPVSLPTQAGIDQSKLNYYKNTGSGINQLQNPFVKGLARAADIVGSVFAPRLDMAIPGTELHHQMLVNQQQGLVDQDNAQAQTQAQADNLAANTALTQAKTEQTTDDINANDAAAKKAAASGSILYDANKNPIGYQDPTGRMMGLHDPALPSNIQDILGGVKSKPPTSEFELWQQQNPNGTAADFQQLQSKPLSKQEADSLNAVWDGLATKHHLPTGQFQAGMPHADATTLAGALNGAIGKQQGDSRVSIDLTGLQSRLGQTPPPGSTDQTGDAYLQSLPPGMANTVKATAAGDIAIPPAGTRNPQAQALRQAVMNYDPTFTDSRYKGKQMFKTGGDAQTITQLATATEHLDNLRNNNSAVGFAPFIGESLTPEATRYNQDVKLFSQEAGKLIKSGVLTEGEYNDLKGGLTSSRQDLRTSAIDELTNLMSGKVSGVFQKYKNATGEDLPADKFFDAPTQQRLQRFGITSPGAAPGISPGAASGVATNAASGDSIPATAAAQLQEGQNHTFNNGQVWTKQGGKPVRVK